MPAQYRYVLDQAVDDILAVLSRRDRNSLREFFRFLADHPFTVGEQHLMDREGRPCEAKAHDRFVVTYRPDHAVREVRIAAIELG